MRNITAYAATLTGAAAAALAINAGIDGLTFGLVDNGVLLIGAYLGFDLGERLGEGRGKLGAVLGCLIGNTVSDGLGAALDGSMPIMGIILGCLLPILLVPLAEILTTKTNN